MTKDKANESPKEMLRMKLALMTDNWYHPAKTDYLIKMGSAMNIKLRLRNFKNACKG
jgi:hypothetical protein